MFTVALNLPYLFAQFCSSHFEERRGGDQKCEERRREEKPGRSCNKLLATMPDRDGNPTPVEMGKFWHFLMKKNPNGAIALLSKRNEDFNHSLIDSALKKQKQSSTLSPVPLDVTWTRLMKALVKEASGLWKCFPFSILSGRQLSIDKMELLWISIEWDNLVCVKGLGNLTVGQANNWEGRRTDRRLMKDYSPLTHAISKKCSLSLINHLIGHGAGVDAKDGIGYTPIAQAVESSQGSTLEQLLRHHQADSNIRLNITHWNVGM